VGVPGVRGARVAVLGLGAATVTGVDRVDRTDVAKALIPGF
jgi:hypothetical protein